MNEQKKLVFDFLHDIDLSQCKIEKWFEVSITTGRDEVIRSELVGYCNNIAPVNLYQDQNPIWGDANRGYAVKSVAVLVIPDGHAYLLSDTIAENLLDANTIITCAKAAATGELHRHNPSSVGR